MAKKGNSESQSTASEFQAALAALTGSDSGLHIEGIDAAVVWLALVEVGKHRASLTIGVTQSGDAWATQIWDGKFPTKAYHRSTDDLNKHLAAVVRAYAGRTLSAEAEEVVRGYGW